MRGKRPGRRTGSCRPKKASSHPLRSSTTSKRSSSRLARHFLPSVRRKNAPRPRPRARDERMQALIATTNITTGWKWLAILIGLGALAAIWLLVGLTNRTIGCRIWRLTEGEDKVPSTSKLQWLIWLTVVLFSYTALWVLRAKAGHYGAITNVPANVLAVLGFSTATAA